MLFKRKFCVDLILQNRPEFAKFVKICTRKTNIKVNPKIMDEKIQYDINREAAKISALSSCKIDKCEYLTDEEILPSAQSRIVEQAKLTYSPLSKAFEKQIKTIEDQGIK